MSREFVTEGKFFTAVASETITAGELVKALSAQDAGSTGRLDNSVYVQSANASGDEYLVVGLAMDNGTTGSKIQVCIMSSSNTHSIVSKP